VKARTAAFLDGLDDRTGYRDIRRYLLDEPLPPGTGWFFTLGSILLFGLGIQVVTGTALALYYAPTPDHAWDSVRFITTEVRFGSFLRGLHHWGATVVVVAAVLHLVRVVLFGSYRKPREVNWIIGVVLLQVILAFGLTGYLLPWDQRAYWATVVSINISKLAPVVGEWLAGFLRGGPEVGALTLTRWYALHVLVLPPVLALLVAAHLYLMRRHGITGPVRERRGTPLEFFPRQAARDLAMALAVGMVLAALAWKGAPALEAPADPAASNYVPRPEWYFLGLFQLLKYFPGKLEVIGALVVPGIAITLLALLPWIDPGKSRAWRDRRFTLVAFAVGLAAVATLTSLGAMDRPTTAAAGTWNLQELAGATLIDTSAQCARCHTATSAIAGPIEAGHLGRPADWLASHVVDPEVIAPGVRQPPDTNPRDTAAILAALARLRSGLAPEQDPSARQAAVLINQNCLTCHLVDGIGGVEGPELSHVGRKYDAASIAKRVNNPVDVKPDAEMPAFGGKLTAAQIQTIAAWLAAKR
jgi:ubiquinol-cytochrome c reductase cytochrome b subunit